MNVTKDPILIKLFQEDSQLVSYYNLISYFRGIYELIDQYAARNELGDQDRYEMDNRLYTLPPPKQHEDRVYTIDFLLMTQYDRGTLETPFTVVRISLNDDLHPKYFQVITHGIYTVLFEYNSKDYKYPASIKAAISARTLVLYNGLSFLHDKAVTNDYHKHQDDIMVTYYCSNLLISEAARSELVRTFILQQNIINMENRESQRIQPETWVHLKKSFNWQLRPTLCLIFSRMDSIHLFGSSRQLFLYLMKLRFIKKTRHIMDMDVVEACKEFMSFDKSQNHQSENGNENPPFKEFNDMLGSAISIYHKYEFVATYSEEEDNRVDSRNSRKKEIDKDIQRLKEKLKELHYLFKTMAGMFDQTEDYKKKIKQYYNVDISDADMRAASEYIQQEYDEVLREDRKEYQCGSKPCSFSAEKYVISIGKRIPYLSIGFGAWLAAERLEQGYYGGACLEVLSGVAYTFPGLEKTTSKFAASLVFNCGKMIFSQKQRKSQKKASISPHQKYRRFAVNICDDIKQIDTDLTNLIIQGERKLVNDWMANPRARFLKFYDKYDDYYFLL